MRLARASYGRFIRAAGRVRVSLVVLLAAATAVCAVVTASQAADISYAYDEAGRLVQVTTPAGSAQYRYDTAGNLISVVRPAAGAVAIAEFSPNAGPAGTVVTIKGSGFSATAASNAVKFNGVAATVSAATLGELKAVVPAGATTGPITVTVGANTGTSPQNFTLAASVPDALPTITTFSPQIADVGATITLSGTNFVGTPDDDLWVRVNGVPAKITSATSTSIQFVVPARTVSGRVTVGTKNGSANSVDILYVPPEGFVAADVSTRVNVAINNVPQTISIASAKKGLVTFDGRAGQRLGLGISALALTPTASGQLYLVHVYGPGGRILESNGPGWNTPGGEYNIPRLPVDGTYTMVFYQSGTNAASFTLTLSEDLTGTIFPDSQTALVFQTNRVGQNAYFSFAGQEGGNISLLWRGATFPGTWSYVKVLAPNDQVVGLTGNFAQGASNNETGTLDVRGLPVTGTYHVFINPYQTSVGQVSVLVHTNDAQLAEVGGEPTTFALVPGQNGDYAFDGLAGQYIGLGIKLMYSTEAGTNATVIVFDPDGQQLIQCETAYLSAGGGECDLPALPKNGRYQVRINPTGVGSLLGTLTLTLDDAAVLGIDGPLKTFDTATTTRIGQNARYTFNVPVGGQLSVVYTNVTFPGGSSTIKILKPNGTELAGTSRLFGTGSYGTSGVIHLLDLTEAGTYTVLIDPGVTTVGKMDVRLRSAINLPLYIDDIATPVILTEGRVGNYIFEGTSGERLGLGISNLVISPAGGVVQRRFYDPDGMEMTVPCDGSSQALECDFPVLTKTGDYIVRLVPNGASSTQASLSLSEDLVIGSSGTVDIQRPGKNARYTFTTTAPGATVSINWSGATIDGAYSAFRVFGPTGAEVGSKAFSKSSGLASSGSPQAFPTLGAAGTYSLVVDPYATSLGKVDIVVTVTPPPAGLSARIANNVQTEAVPVATGGDPGDGDIPIPLWALLALGGAMFGFARRAQKTE